MQTFLILLVSLVILGIGWIRFAPTNSDDWHVDPAEAGDPGAQGYRLIGLDAPRLPGHPDEVLGALVEVARSEPRVRLLDGSIDEGMITFVARTKWIGFRDYVTVKAVDEGRATKVSVTSRSRYEVGSDWGVNRNRVEHWFAELERVLSE